MIAYQFTTDGYFAGKLEDCGVLPSNATRIKPDIIRGFIPCWDGEKWEQIEDHRGVVGYLEGQPYIITQPGPYPQGFSLDMPEINNIIN